MLLILAGCFLLALGWWLTGIANELAVHYLPTIIGVPLLIAAAGVGASSLIPFSMGTIEIINYFKYG